MSSPTQSALTGVRVLALEQAVAGPLASRMLSDMGAEVIKVERLGTGDVIRGWDSVVRGISTGFVWANRNKRSISVDVKTAEGHVMLKRIADRSDVFISNLGPGAIDRLGLDYETLRTTNPQLVHCVVSGYGATGPYRTDKAYDLIMQGETGLLSTTGSPGSPARIGVPISDIAGAMHAALGIVIALYQRRSTGRGQSVDIAMFDASLDWLGYFPHHYWHSGQEPELHGVHHQYIVPYGPYPARDGRSVSTSVANDADWKTLCVDVLGRPDLFADERFDSMEKRRDNRTALEQVIKAELDTRDADEWVSLMRDAGLPAGRLRTIGEALDHPQAHARDLIRQVASPVGPVPTIESALRMSDSPVADGPIPALGADTDAVLRETGYSDDEIAGLKSRKVVE